MWSHHCGRSEVFFGTFLCILVTGFVCLFLQKWGHSLPVVLYVTILRIVPPTWGGEETEAQRGEWHTTAQYRAFLAWQRSEDLWVQGTSLIRTWEFSSVWHVTGLDKGRKHRKKLAPIAQASLPPFTVSLPVLPSSLFSTASLLPWQPHFQSLMQYLLLWWTQKSPVISLQKRLCLPCSSCRMTTIHTSSSWDRSHRKDHIPLIS